jgi:hypothetical protein
MWKAEQEKALNYDDNLRNDVDLAVDVDLAGSVHWADGTDGQHDYEAVQK